MAATPKNPMMCNSTATSDANETPVQELRRVHRAVLSSDSWAAGQSKHHCERRRSYSRFDRRVSVLKRVTASRRELGSRVWHRTNCYLNNRLEQDHRGIKGRCRPMLGFKSVPSATRYCRGHDELRNFLLSRSRMCQHVPAASRRFHYMRQTAIALGIMEAA